MRQYLLLSVIVMSFLCSCRKEPSAPSFSEATSFSGVIYVKSSTNYTIATRDNPSQPVVSYDVYQMDTTGGNQKFLFSYKGGPSSVGVNQLIYASNSYAVFDTVYAVNSNGQKKLLFMIKAVSVGGSADAVAGITLSPDQKKVFFYEMNNSFTNETSPSVDAFISESLNGSQIFSIPYVSSVSDGGGQLDNISISPDNTQLYYNFSPNSGHFGTSSGGLNHQIWTSSVTGANRKALTSFPYYTEGVESLSLSPDGKKIYFVSSNYEVYMTDSLVVSLSSMNTDGSDVKTIVHFETGAVWPSADNKYLFYTAVGADSASHVFRMNTDGSEIKQFTSGKGEYVIGLIN